MLLPYYPSWNGPGPSVNNSSVSVCFITEHWHLSHLLKSNSHSWWDFAFVFVLQAGGERPNLSVWAHSVLSAWLMYFIRPVTYRGRSHWKWFIFSLSPYFSACLTISICLTLWWVGTPDIAVSSRSHVTASLSNCSENPPQREWCWICITCMCGRGPNWNWALLCLLEDQQNPWEGLDLHALVFLFIFDLTTDGCINNWEEITTRPLCS